MSNPEAKFFITAEDRTAAGVNSADGRLNQLTKSFGSLATASKIATGYLSVSLLTNFARAAFETADAIGDMSAKFGVSATELSRLKYIANQSDVEFVSLGTGIKQLQKNLSEGDKVFKELGLSAEALKNLSLTEQFEALAVAFKGVENPADRTRLAMALFGKAGTDLLPFLDQGPDGMRRLADEAQRVGAVMSDETARGVSAADESIKRMKSSVEGMTALLIAKFAPAIAGAADGIRGLAGGATEMEKLEDKLAHLKDWENDTIPVMLNFGYVEGGSFVMGRGAIESEITKIEARIEQLKNKSSSAGTGTASVNLAPQTDLLPDEYISEILQQNADKAITVVAEVNRELTELIQQFQAENLGDSYRAQAEVAAASLASIKPILTDLDSSIAASNARQVADAYTTANAKVQAEQQAAEQRKAIENSVVSSGIQALTAWNNASTTKSKQLVAINKAVAMAQAIQNTYAGATKALAQGGIYGYASAAAIIAFGMAQVAAIARTNYGSTSTSATTSGSSVNPVYTTTDEDDESSQGASQQSAVQITINGDIFGSNDTKQWLIDTLQEAVNEQDVVIISGNSRQAAELVTT